MHIYKFYIYIYNLFNGYPKFTHQDKQKRRKGYKEMREECKRYFNMCKRVFKESKQQRGRRADSVI